MNACELLIVGQPSLDVNTDHDGVTVREIGGAVIYSGYAAAALGHQVCVAAKANPATINVADSFAQAPSIAVVAIPSPDSTSIENVYHSADKERRTCRALSRIEPYAIAELPNVDAQLWQLAGLMQGDISEELIAYAATQSDVALDVQCLLRCADGPNGAMVFRDWEQKLEFLPLIRFLKTDAAEAEILTGSSDRFAAAKQLHDWGAAEVMVTHNTEALIFDGLDFYTEPLRPRNLSGRSGRGDTCFASYITERLTQPIPDALRTAAALVSLKMETPGPFRGTRADVDAYARLR